MTKRVILAALTATLLLTSCHESLEKRAAREAREFTESNCPTPVQNFIRTDSLTFDIPTKTYWYYCTMTGPLDSAEIIPRFKSLAVEKLREGISSNTNLKVYKDAGFAFGYVMHSEKNPEKIYFKIVIDSKQYKRP